MKALGRLALGLGIGAVVAFAAALAVSATIPSSGSASLEAVVTVFASAGGTAATVAIALGGILLTLRLQASEARSSRREELQLDLMKQSLEILRKTSGEFGRVVSLYEEYFNALDEHKPEAKERTRAAVQAFYDAQRWGTLNELEALIESEPFKEALKKADGALRGWNEQVAGDHTTTAVYVDAVKGLPLKTFSELRDAYEQALKAYSESIRQR